MKRAGQSGPPEPILLLDENISGAKVHSLLERAGVRVVRFLDHLERGAPDEMVIAKAEQLGAILVSRDRDFRRHRATSVAFKASNARVIWVTAKEAGSPDVLASLLVRAWGRIAVFVANENPPALARLDGTARLTKESLR